MEIQEVFDKVASHLLKQGKQSMNNALNVCAYRGSGGLMCAVGCLIEDEFYSFELEGQRAFRVQVRAALRRSIGDFDGGVAQLLDSLQVMHDDAPPEFWSDRLSQIARSYGLEFNKGE